MAKDIMDYIELWAPSELAEDWDNVGFQIGNHKKEVKSILLSLDLDHRVLEDASRRNIDMVISHHPFIFGGLKKINSLDYDGRLIMELIKQDIVYYSAHTNLDQAVMGVSDELGKIFKLKDREKLTKLEENKKFGYGSIGNIEKTNLLDYIQEIKKVLNLNSVVVYEENLKKTIERVALVGGSGSDFIIEAKEKGADLLITGDIKYHDGQMAEKLGISLIDVGHYHSEKVILPVVKKKLEEMDKDLDIFIYEKPSPIYNIF